jgi:hypothetical protein
MPTRLRQGKDDTALPSDVTYSHALSPLRMMSSASLAKKRAGSEIAGLVASG